MKRLLELLRDLWDVPYSRCQAWRILAERALQK